jgi:type IV pilus secretin PilQ/predicted competence protein
MRFSQARNTLLLVSLLIVGLVGGATRAHCAGEINSIGLVPDKRTILVGYTGNVSRPNSVIVLNPTRLVIDFAGTGLAKSVPKALPGFDELKEIRAWASKTKMRLVLDFQGSPAPKYNVSFGDEGLVISLAKAPGSSAQGTAGSEVKKLQKPFLKENKEVKAARQSTIKASVKSPAKDPQSSLAAEKEAVQSPTTAPTGVTSWLDDSFAPVEAKAGASYQSNNGASATEPDASSQTDKPAVQLAQGMDLNPQPHSMPTVSGQIDRKQRSIQPAPRNFPSAPNAPVGKPEDARQPGERVASTQDTTGGRQLPREVRPPVTPPSPDPRLAEQLINELRFVQVGHDSRLIIRGGDKLDYRVGTISSTKLRLDLINAEIPKAHQKPLRTDLFSTSVEMIVPGSQSIFIQLKEYVPYKVEKKKGVLMVDFPPPMFDPSLYKQTAQGRDGGKPQAAGSDGQDPQKAQETEALKKEIAELDKDRGKLEQYNMPIAGEILQKTVSMDFQGIKLSNALRLISAEAEIDIVLDPDVESPAKRQGSSKFEQNPGYESSTSGSVEQSQEGKKDNTTNSMKGSKSEKDTDTSKITHQSDTSYEGIIDGKNKGVTLHLSKVPLKDVIDIILVSYNLDYMMMGDVMRIGKKETIKAFKGENREKIRLLDRKLKEKKTALDILEKQQVREAQKDEIEQEPIFVAAERDPADTDPSKSPSERTYYARVKLSYADPVQVVRTLNCLFNSDCPKHDPEAEKGCEGAAVKDQAGMPGTLADKEKQLSQQGFLPGSPGYTDRMRTFQQDQRDEQKTQALKLESDAKVAEAMGRTTTGSGMTGFPSFGTQEPQTKLWPDCTNRLVFIKDTADRIHQMKKMVATLDVPKPQVVIESRIVRASKEWSRGLGIIWGGRNNQNGIITNNKRGFWGITGHQPTEFKAPGSGGWGPTNAATGQNASTGNPIRDTAEVVTLEQGAQVVSTATSDIPNTFAVNLPAVVNNLTHLMGVGMQFGLLGTNYISELDFRLQIGEHNNQARIVARPKVQVLDRQQASILRGQQIPYLSSSANSGPQTQFVDANLELKVTPSIFPDSRINMALEVKDDQAGVPLTPTGQPPINTRRAKTTMIVKDGETAVIGGIIRDVEEKQKDGWPGLMNVPVVGYLFSNKSSSRDGDELLVFVTPTIVKRPPLAP